MQTHSLPKPQKPRPLYSSFYPTEARKNKRVMKVPKGTSDYQATWIVDEDDNGELKGESSEEEEDDDDEMLDEAMDEEDEDICSQVLWFFIAKLRST